MGFFLDDNSLLVLLGNQLFPEDEILKTNCRHIFMAEDLGLCTDFKHHKLKILMFFSAMREYRDALIKKGYNVFYFSIEDNTFEISFEKKLEKIFKENNFNKINVFEIENFFFSQKLFNHFSKLGIGIHEIKSPMFLCNKSEFCSFANSYKSLRMENFYKVMRRKLNILIDEKSNPIGGKWSFDSENRKKLPKKITIPRIPKIYFPKKYTSLKDIVNKKFHNHPGDLDHMWMPINRKQSLDWFDEFLNYKMKNFGDYEDAVSTKDNFLFHSALSPIMNMGLLTPKEIIEKTVEFYNKNSIPINSFEGFVRQIIGWREFIRGLYHLKGREMISSNFWKHKRKLSEHWYDGTTGIKPLDDAIISCKQYGYTHHIPRLMIICNLMNLSEIDPNEIYKWFMEMFIDSSDWVMVPNVYGMGTYSDGGIFATKPYSCGSNYILKMSDYKKEAWCDTVDGLYWHFLEKHRVFFEKSHRLSTITRYLDKMPTERKKYIFSKANQFIKLCTN